MKYADMAKKPSINRTFKDTLYEHSAQIGKAVANGKRLELLDLLCQGERTVEDLAREMTTSVSGVSQHLRVLKAARLVESHKEGLFVFYRLADPAVGEFFRALRSLTVRRLADAREAIRQFLEDRDGMEKVSLEQLRARSARGDVVVLDVRPEAEFQAGHIPKALSIPLKHLAARLSEIPADREVVAYCRGPYCVLSLEAVILLRTKGFRARRLEEGLPEWKARGFRVVAG
jgi:rhodanese-related sulfurtransferase